MPIRVQAALLTAIDDGPQAVSLFDPEDNLAYGNRAYCEAWNVDTQGRPSFAAIMRACHATGTGALIETDDIDAWVRSAEERRRSGPAFRAFEVDLCDGRWFWMTERRLEDGWLLSLGQDITALKHNEQTLRAARDVAIRLALTDPLTKLPNRRRALEVLEARLAAKQDFYLALIDIDHFKGFNDNFGHAVGDTVLTAVAGHLEHLEVAGCMVARLAGDEFAVIGPPQRDRAWFEHLLRAFAKTVAKPVKADGHTICTKLSIGVARSIDHNAEPSALLAAADSAMYVAKRSGRSHIRFTNIS